MKNRLFNALFLLLLVSSCSVCKYQHFDSYVSENGNVYYKGCIECKTSAKDIKKTILKLKK